MGVGKWLRSGAGRQGAGGGGGLGEGGTLAQLFFCAVLLFCGLPRDTYLHLTKSEAKTWDCVILKYKLAETFKKRSVSESQTHPLATSTSSQIC